MQKVFLIFISCFFISCFQEDSDEIKPIVDKQYWPVELPNKSGYVFKGLAFENNLTDEIYDAHASWVHGCVGYDYKTEKMILFYNVSNGHVLANTKVLLRLKNSKDNFSKPIIVADRMSEGISCKTQAAGVASNGDYLALVAHYRNDQGNYPPSFGASIYRSKDKGLSWERADMLVNNNPILAYNGDVSGFLVLKSGRIITMYCEATSRKTHILYSDDNGYTWKESSLPNSYNHSEPAWCELSDGAIVAYFRKSVGEGVSKPIPPYFTKSSDGGITWEAFKPSNSIPNMTEANGHLLVNRITGMVEFIYHSRFAESDGKSSLFVCTVSQQDALLDKIDEPIRVLQLPAQGLGDSGYVGAAQESNGDISAFFYCGTNKDANIFFIKKNNK